MFKLSRILPILLSLTFLSTGVSFAQMSTPPPASGAMPGASGAPKPAQKSGSKCNKQGECPKHNKKKAKKQQTNGSMPQPAPSGR
jgi:hypothetical protein